MARKGQQSALPIDPPAFEEGQRVKCVAFGVSRDGKYAGAMPSGYLRIERSDGFVNYHPSEVRAA